MVIKEGVVLRVRAMIVQCPNMSRRQMEETPVHRCAVMSRNGNLGALFINTTEIFQYQVDNVVRSSRNKGRWCLMK